MKKNINRFCVALFILLFSSCFDSKISTKKTENIERVLMHEPGDFSFFIKSQSEEVDTLVWKRVRAINGIPWKIMADVPSDKKMWISESRDEGAMRLLGLEIHVHSAQDINGAGWDHGKFGRGQTQVIE